MRITKKNAYQFIGRKCRSKYPWAKDTVYVIVGLNSKGRLLILREGEEDGILNRIPEYISDMRLID